MKSLIVLFALFSGTVALAQDFQTRFADLFYKNDTTAQIQLLREWTTASPNDPELAVAYYNYFVDRSRREVVSITDEPMSQESLEMTDSTGRTFYMGSVIHYDADTLQKAFTYIDKGLAANPDRLDMWLGKIYMLGKSEKFETFVKEILRMVEHSATNKHAWRWTNGEPKEDAERSFFEAVQGYIGTLYERDDQIPNMRRVAEGVLAFYPNNIPNLSNAAISYIMTEDYDRALGYLQKAETLDPKDCIVLNNIAETYSKKNDIAKSIEYFNKMITWGGEEDRLYAQQKIEELSKK